MSASSITREDLQSDVLQQFRPCRATGCGWADQASGQPTRERGAAASGIGPASGPPPALPRPCLARGGARAVPLPLPTAARPPSPHPGRGGGNCGPCPSSARELRARWGLAGGRAAVRTSLLKVFTASMLSAQRPGARRRKRRRPARRVRKGGRATDPGGRGARRAGDAPQRRRGPGMAAGRAQRTGRRPPGRVGGGGGAGAGAFAASPPRSAATSVLRLRSPALSTPFSSFLFLPRALVWPRCRLGRANLQRAAKTQEEALTAAAAASNMADAVGPRIRSRRRRPARPLATGPRVARGRAGPSRRAARARAAGIAEAGEGRRRPALGASAAARTGGTDRGGSRGGALRGIPKCGRGAGRDGGDCSVSMAVPQWDGPWRPGASAFDNFSWVLTCRRSPGRIPRRQRVPERPRRGEQTCHTKAGMGRVHAATVRAMRA